MEDLKTRLDALVGRVARELGLLERKQDDRVAVELLTDKLREYDINAQSVTISHCSGIVNNKNINEHERNILFRTRLQRAQRPEIAKRTFRPWR